MNFHLKSTFFELKCLYLLGPVQFDPKTDRSVLGSLRTADIDLSWLIHEQHVLDCNPLEIALKLNERPTSVMGKYLFPKKAMLERIETLLTQ